jgi:NADH:ubiquinone oxidoreductase subunit
MFQSSKELKEEVDEICDSLLQDEACDQNMSSPHVQTGKHRRTVSFEGFRRMDSNFLDPIEKHWLELLHKRPNENDEVKMREWTQKVLQISAEKKSAISDRPLKCLKTAKCIPLTTVSKANPRPNFSIQSFEITNKKGAQSDTEVIEYSSLFDEVDFDRLFDY